MAALGILVCEPEWPVWAVCRNSLQRAHSRATTHTDSKTFSTYGDGLIRWPFPKHLIDLRIERLDGFGICLSTRQSLLRLTGSR